MIDNEKLFDIEVIERDGQKFIRLIPKLEAFRRLLSRMISSDGKKKTGNFWLDRK